jgi:hypothetical protein
LEQWKNSTYFQEVKNNFIQGKKHPGCENCWQIESLGQQSYRQMVSNDYKFFKIDTGFDKLVNVEINLSNLCNLKCLMCNEKSSSAILAENQKLGINLHEQKDFAWTDRAYDHLQQILKNKPAIISIVGGEPLYNKELLNLLEKRNYCVNDRGNILYSITSRQEKIYDMTFAHLIEQNYIIRTQIIKFISCNILMY